MTIQQLFSPLSYGFRWIADGTEHWWYEYDGKDAERAALKARNAEAKRLTKAGRTVRKISLGRQLVSRGGIGTPNPHIELVIPVYGLEIV